MKNNTGFVKLLRSVWAALVLTFGVFTSTAFADVGLYNAPLDTFGSFVLYFCRLIGIFGAGICVVRLGMAVQERDTESAVQRALFTVGCILLAFASEILTAVGLM